MKKRFKCEVDCANCAAKMTDAVKKLDGVQDANVNFMTQKFTLEADEDRFDDILALSLKTMQRIEPDFRLL